MFETPLAARGLSPVYASAQDPVLAAIRSIKAQGPTDAALATLDATVTDMAQWLRLHLGGGVYAGSRLLSAEVVAEMQKQLEESGIFDNVRTKWGDSNALGNYSFEVSAQIVFPARFDGVIMRSIEPLQMLGV